MADFDIISAASKAYKKSWEARSYLYRLAAVPLALNLICLTLALTFAGGGDSKPDNHLLFLLIMLPALAAEGWMVSHYVRYLILGHLWPFRASGNLDPDLAALRIRARGILGGMVVYILINMVIGLLSKFVLQYMAPYMPPEGSNAPVDVPGHVVALSFALLVFFFWGFRLVWLYIPYALNMDAKAYIQRLKGFSSSMPLIGVWLLCLLPFLLAPFLVMSVFGQMLQAVFGMGAVAAIGILVSVVADIGKLLVTTAGITYGLQEIFAKPERKGTAV